MPNFFKNKIVVITGGAGGLATALIEELLNQGAKIAALDLNVEGLSTSESLLPLTVDITDSLALENAVSKIIEAFGRIDMLFNNAGITHLSTFKDTSAELFEKIMMVNFTASVNLTRLCLPHLEQAKGQIIAISSVAGLAPLFGRSAYSASKHAMTGFYHSLGSELHDQGVNILVVSPSFVKSRPELKAKVNAGASSPGAMKKNTNGEAISPSLAAKSILTAVRKRKRSLYLGKVSKIAYWLHSLAPNLYLKIMTKNAKTEFT